MTAQSAAPQPATTAARKVTSAVNAAPLKRKNHVIAAVKSAISRASVPLPLEELRPEVWVADIPAAEEEAAARSATSAEKSAILLATAPKVVLEATRVADTVEAEDMAVATGLDAHSRPATPAADTDTCLVIAPRDRNVTTVGFLLLLSPGQADRTSRRRSWPSESRLPIGAHFRARLLQMQATRTRPGDVPQLIIDPLSWNPCIIAWNWHRLVLAKKGKAPLQKTTHHHLGNLRSGEKEKESSEHRAPGYSFHFHV